MHALRVLCRAEVELSQLIRHCVCNGHLHTDIHSVETTMPQCSVTGNGHLCNAMGTSTLIHTLETTMHWASPVLHNVIGSCTMQWCSAVQCSMGRFAVGRAMQQCTVAMAPPPVKMPLPHQCCATAKRFIPVHWDLWDWSTHTCHPRSRFLSFLNALIYLSVICSTMWVLWFNSGIYSTMWDMGTRILLCHLLHHVGNLIQDLCKDQRHDVHDILVMGL